MQLYIDFSIQAFILILLLLLIIIAFKTIGILNRVKNIASSVEEIIDTFNVVLWQPIKIFSFIIEKIQNLIKK